MDALTFLLERPTADYTMVCNAVLRDRSISLRGKGLEALVFSKPSGWIFHEKALPAESTEGRDALRAAMKELLTARWVQKCQPREGGKFGGITFRMHMTVDWKTVDGSIGDGKSTTSNTDTIKTDKPIPHPPRGSRTDSKKSGRQSEAEALPSTFASAHSKPTSLQSSGETNTRTFSPR